MIRILVVDDDEVTRKLLREVLEKEGYVVRLAANGEEAIRAISREAFPVIISDIRMAEIDGMAVLRAAKQTKRHSSIILMTGFGSMDGAIEAIKEGAFDYISKPFKMVDLTAVVARAIKQQESMHGPAAQLPHIEVTTKGLIGKSPKIVEVYKTVARASLSASNVLILGESGTGKELVAKAIHQNSQRRNKKFIAVNCGALAETLLESELFGHVKGSFTNAISDKKGLFEEANGGTLFLDEIGDVSIALQIKLLRVIQENEFKPVGASESRKADIRVIAATHRDLEQMVKAGKFREDLYYRLKVISIELPPLRDRIEDLPELVSYFLSVYADKNKKNVSHVSESAMALLSSYLWPGNIRELEHAIERAVAMTNTSILFPESFPSEISRNEADVVSEKSHTQEVPSSLEVIERAHIVKILSEVNFNKSKAAEILGIDRATLYRKAQRYGIDLRGK